MKIISKINILSLSKISGIFGAIFGFLLTTLGLIFVKIFNPEDIGVVSFLDVISATAISIIIYGIIGFLGGLICAFLYNLITKYTKGIKIEFK
jgi:putative effector of murein hydrolase LrgA (UPF0299 family)